ncbi:hypothetical protein HanRHA438_Chr02g0079631 [Helianthus annuus]|nr:hypothetical protein HanRHA438_Chr02g0079631 [Helianthus annuus]
MRSLGPESRGIRQELHVRETLLYVQPKVASLISYVCQPFYQVTIQNLFTRLVVFTYQPSTGPKFDVMCMKRHLKALRRLLTTSHLWCK